MVGRRDHRLKLQRKPTFAHRTAWRALVPAESVPLHFRSDMVNLWLGPDAHLVHYPVKGGRLINIVGIVNDEWNETGWQAAGDRDEILRHFARFSWADNVRELIAVPDQWLKWALYDRATPFAGGAGPVTLIGDAAHPMLPFLAQGAGMAIEDAAVLAGCMKANAGAPEAGLRSYETARRARTERAQQVSRKQGKHLWADRPGSARCAISACACWAEKDCSGATTGFIVGSTRAHDPESGHRFSDRIMRE